MGKRFVAAVKGAAVSAGADALAEEYERADRCGPVRVGDSHVFADGLARVRCLPLAEVAWAYQRQEDSRLTCCCGAGTISTHYLVLSTAGNRQWKIEVERKADAERALEAVARRSPNAETGYSEALARRFA